MKTRRIGPAVFFIGLIALGSTLLWWGMQPAEPEPAPEPEVLFDSSDRNTYSDMTLDETVLLASDQLSDVENGVAVPALNIVSPMIHTGHTDGWLDLPDPPYSTRFDQSATIGSPEGASIIASHVDYGHGEDAPFSVLHKIEKGTPYIVKSNSKLFVYQTAEIDLYTRQGLPSDMFRLEGDPLSYLVTCSGPVIERDGELPFYENNLVVAGMLLGEATVSGQEVSIQ